MVCVKMQETNKINCEFAESKSKWKVWKKHITFAGQEDAWKRDVTVRSVCVADQQCEADHGS